MEPKTERFKRIASARVNKITAMIRLLGNCAHTGNYEYTDEQVELIFEKLHFELDKAQARYELERRRFSLSNFQETHFPSVKLKLPDGTVLQAIAIDDIDVPAVEVKLLEKDKDPKTICCVEYNYNRTKGEHLCVGMFNNKTDFERFYESYNERTLTMAQEFKGLMLTWDMVSKLISKSVRQILKKEFTCKAKMDDYDYWTVSFKDQRLLTEEVEQMLNYFKVTGEDYEDCMPEKGKKDVPDFDMMLAELLLGKQLGCNWEKSIPYEDKLVLLNVRKTV